MVAEKLQELLHISPCEYLSRSSFTTPHADITAGIRYTRKIFCYPIRILRSVYSRKSGRGGRRSATELADEILHRLVDTKIKEIVGFDSRFAEGHEERTGPVGKSTFCLV